MKRPEFEPIKREDGTSEFFDFLDSLPDKDAAKLLATIKKIEEKGLLVAKSQEWVKKLDTNLFEVRAQVGSNIQRGVYFHFENNKYMITHGFTKKTQKTPKREISRGKSIRASFLLEKRNHHE